MVKRCVSKEKYEERIKKLYELIEKLVDEHETEKAALEIFKQK